MTMLSSLTWDFPNAITDDSNRNPSVNEKRKSDDSVKRTSFCFLSVSFREPTETKPGPAGRYYKLYSTAGPDDFSKIQIISW